MISVYARKRPLFERETNKGEFDVVTIGASKSNEIVVHNCQMHADLKRMFVKHGMFSLHGHAFDEDVEEMNASRPRRRAFEVLEKAKKAVATDGDVEGKKKKKTLRILFLRSPTALLPEVDDDDANPSSLGFVKIRKNILEGPTGNRKAKTLSDDLVGSEDETILPCDILIRSVGYVGDKLEPSLIPSDNNGTIAHDGLGRVQYKTDDSSATGRLYVCGWAKRGASGVIATNVQCAEETGVGGDAIVHQASEAGVNGGSGEG